MRRRNFLLCCLLLPLAACQAAPQEPLPPNEFVFPAGKTQTKEAIIATFLSQEYQIVRDSEFQLVMDRPVRDDFAASFLFGSQWNSTPNARVAMTFLGENPTRVTTQVQIVTNPGTGFERVTSLDQNRNWRASVANGMGMAGSLLQ